MKRVLTTRLAHSLNGVAPARRGARCQIQTAQCRRPTARLRRTFHSTSTHAAVKPYLLADIGEGITECQLVQWLVKPGDKVEQFDPICEVSSDKATVEITSRFDGEIKELLHEEGDQALVGQPLLMMDVLEEPDEDSASVDLMPEQPAKQEVERSSKEEQITKEEIQRHLPKTGTSERESLNQPQQESSKLLGEDNIVPLNSIERHMFAAMTQSLTIPHFLFTHTIDVTQINRRRRGDNANRSTKLTLLPFVIKAISQVMKTMPKLNSHLDAKDFSKPCLILKRSHNFGLAVDTDQGLLVPVVRDVQNRSITDLAAEIQRLGDLARRSRLSPADFQGATFNISNIGSIGGDAIAPIIVAPMVAIVGIGRVTETPVFVKNEEGGDVIEKRERVVLSWSADHRILDGATVAKAANAVDTMLHDEAEMSASL